MAKLSIVPISRAEAQQFVSEYHRHLGPVTGAVFQLACASDSHIRGVAICGRPVNRTLDDGMDPRSQSLLHRRHKKRKLDALCGLLASCTSARLPKIDNLYPTR